MGKVTSAQLTQAYPIPNAKEPREGKGLMNAYSVMTRVLRPANEVSAAFEVRQPILMPRTAADDLPPYREQPWIIDRGAYRKIDPSMTLAREQV